MLRFLRMSDSLGQNIGAGFKFILVVLAAGLLPIWQGRAMLPASHSLWIFIGLMLLGPVLYLVFEWVFKKGSGWPIVLIAAERTIGSATVLFILSITLVAMTGGDSFLEFQNIQKSHGWLIFHNPMAILLLGAFAVVNLFSSFQTIFSRTGDEKQSGWSFNENQSFPFAVRCGRFFIADVFLGSADVENIPGVIFLIFKCVGVNLISVIVSHLFFQLREDQAEAFIFMEAWPPSPLLFWRFAFCFRGTLREKLAIYSRFRDFYFNIFVRPFCLCRGISCPKHSFIYRNGFGFCFWYYLADLS